jgi:hypothetical protein
MKRTTLTDEEILACIEAACRCPGLQTVSTSLDLLAREQWGANTSLLWHPDDLNAFLRGQARENIRPQFILTEPLTVLEKISQTLETEDTEETELRHQIKRSLLAELGDQRFEAAHGPAGQSTTPSSTP